MQVMLDADRAKLYGVTTSNLNLAVRRNIDRFPSDFMFQLKKPDLEGLRMQFAISKEGRLSWRDFGTVFGAIRQMLEKPLPAKKASGFHAKPDVRNARSRTAIPATSNTK
jgi:ORF6N domain